MLAHCLRHWCNIKQTSGERLVFAWESEQLWSFGPHASECHQATTSIKPIFHHTMIVCIAKMSQGRGRSDMVRVSMSWTPQGPIPLKILKVRFSSFFKWKWEKVEIILKLRILSGMDPQDTHLFISMMGGKIFIDMIPHLAVLQKYRVVNASNSNGFAQVTLHLGQLTLTTLKYFCRSRGNQRVKVLIASIAVSGLFICHTSRTISWRNEHSI